jgi:hypothetical protein
MITWMLSSRWMIWLKYDWMITWMLTSGWMIWFKYDWMITSMLSSGWKIAFIIIENITHSPCTGIPTDLYILLKTLAFPLPSGFGL